MNEIAKLRPGSTFLVLHKYQNEQGEVSNFNIIFHISYKNALTKSIEIVKRFVPQNDLQTRARAEVLSSLKESLHRVETIPIDEIKDAYYRYKTKDGEVIGGVKLHTSSNVLHLFGLIHQKRILVPGTYKVVNSRPLTIEKNKIRLLCPVSKFRQFRLHPLQVERIKVQHISLLPPEDN